MGNIWDREPVMVMAVVQTGIALLTAFGLNLTGEQVGAIMAFSAAVIGLIVRRQVTPTESMPVNVNKVVPAVLLAIALSIGAVVTGCAQRNPNITTPAGERAVRETAAVQRIGELQNLVIAASDAKRFPQPTARVIVQWTVNTLELIKSKPTGWVPAALNTWSTVDADPNMPGVQTPRFLVATGPSDVAAFVPIVDELLKGL